MRDLKDVRLDINETDLKIIELFEKRMDLSIEVANYKIANSMPIFDSKREAEKLEAVKKQVSNPLYAEWAAKLMGDLMTYSKEYQKTIIDKASEDKIAFQGIHGANSEEAALAFFGASPTLVPCETFEDVFCAVSRGECKFGVLPFENSLTGTISEVFDLLLKYDLHIAGEYHLKINHQLLACEGAAISDIKKVISHPQALEQCSKFLNSLNNAEKEPYLNTALSAKHVSESGDKTLAAIASPRAAKSYGLKVLSENIANSETNTTRFIIISKDAAPIGKADKVSAIFALSHTYGSLSGYLANFAKYNTNLLKLESRPVSDNVSSFNFFVDFIADPEGESFAELLECLKEQSTYFKLLGTYKNNA